MELSSYCEDTAWICLYTDDAIWLLRLIVPISLTIGLFVYRERKKIGLLKIQESKSHTFIYRGYFGISVLFIIWIVALRYGILIERVPITITEIVSLSLFILWILFVVLSSKAIRESINIHKVAKYNLMNFSKSTEQILRRLERFKEEKYPAQAWYIHKVENYINNSNLYIQQNYHILAAKNKLNLINDFDETFISYNRKIVDFISTINTDFFLMVNNRNYENYFKLYKAALEYNVHLLRSLNDNATHTNIKESIYHFNKLSLNLTKNLFKKEDLQIKESYLLEYYKSAFELVNILREKPHDYIPTLLKNLKEQESASSTDDMIDEADFLSLLTTILYLGIEKDNIKLVTEVTNMILELENDSIPTEVNKLFRSKISTISNTFNSVLGPLGLESDNQDQNRLEKNKKRIVSYKKYKTNIGILFKHENFSKKSLLNTSISTILILHIIKSVELGNYKSAGFIVKVLVKRMPSKYISRALDLIKKSLDDLANINKLQLDLKYINKSIINEMNLDFNFSYISVEYCFQKTIYLIIGQRNFLIKNNIYDTINNKTLNILYFIPERNIIKFLKNKVRRLDKEYGLIYLREE